MLQGHVDVVPPGDLAQWRGDPFEPTLARRPACTGRGACDMKAGVVANLAACAAIARSGVRLRGGVALHLVVGEEDGGLGAFGTLPRGHTGDACIITEPTSGTLITGAAGALTFTLEVPGPATHASTPYAGHSAHRLLPAAPPGARRAAGRAQPHVVEPLMREYPVPYPLVVGRLQAGDWSSSVPDLLVAEGRLGLRIEEDPADARRRAGAVRRRGRRAGPLPARPPAGAPLVRRPVRRRPPAGRAPAARRWWPTRTPTSPAATGCASGARRTAATCGSTPAPGIPTLHYGPGDVRLAHGPDEAVELDEVLTVTRALVLAVLRSCGAE